MLLGNGREQDNSLKSTKKDSPKKREQTSLLLGNKEITCVLAGLVGASRATDLKLVRDRIRVCFFQMVLDDVGHGINKYWICV